MTWTSTDIPDQHGRTAVVTGANGGLGYETASALAGAGAHVVMAARDQVKAQRAAERIVETHPAASLELVPLDLGDLASVRTAASTIASAHPTIDLLVNNAGLMAMPEATTADGFEMQFGVNHLGHFALTALLLEPILRGSRSMVVTGLLVLAFVVLVTIGAAAALACGLRYAEVWGWLGNWVS